MSHLTHSIALSSVYIDQRADLQPALNDNLFNKVLAAPNLKQAWQQVRSNKEAPGVDGLRIDEFLE